VLDEQAQVSSMSAHDLQRHHDVRNHQRVLKEEAFDSAVARSPSESGERNLAHATEVRGTAAGKSVGDAA
jgi:hypothetical protein